MVLSLAQKKRPNKQNNSCPVEEDFSGWSWVATWKNHPRTIRTQLAGYLRAGLEVPPHRARHGGGDCCGRCFLDAVHGGVESFESAAFSIAKCHRRA